MTNQSALRPSVCPLPFWRPHSFEVESQRGMDGLGEWPGGMERERERERERIRKKDLEYERTVMGLGSKDSTDSQKRCCIFW